MWSVFRFSLSGGGEHAYRDALEILRCAGFRRARGPERIAADAAGPFPAAVVADVLRDPAEVTRAIFAALHEGGLRPVAVSGCAMEERPPAERAARA